MNILLFGGFLGSGKTSIILQIAKYLVDPIQGLNSIRQLNSGKPTLVIIENEVGEAGIDDKILKAEGLSVRNLFAGCICCTLNAELTVCLNKIQQELSPHWVIIETTGMAFPGRIAATINQYGKEIDSLRTIVVADAERWDELSTVMPGLIEGQITQADVILLNKIDCLEPSQIGDVEGNIKRINPSALIYALSAHQEIAPLIWYQVVGGK